MGASNWSGPVFVSGVNVLGLRTGNDYYVHSGTGNAKFDGVDPTYPKATIATALALCTASVGDRVIVMPGHAETIASAAALALSVVGVDIIGLGVGTDRPTLTFTATASTVTMTAANVRVVNFHFINDIDALVVGIPVTAAHCEFVNCTFDDATDAKQSVHWITLSAAADYFSLIDCVHHGSDTAGATAFLTGAAADHVHIKNLQSHGDLSAANIDMSAAWTDCLIEDCVLENANAVDVNIEGFSAATGMIRNNSLRIATNGQVTWVNTLGSLSLAENYGVNANAETGMLVGTVSS